MKSLFDINRYIVERVGFSYGQWLLAAAILFALICLCFVLLARRGRVKVRQLFIETGWTALWYFGLVALSFITFWPFGDKKPLWEPGRSALVWCVAGAVVALLYVLYFQKRKKHVADKVSANAIRKSAADSGAAKYCFALLFAGMLVSSVICGVRAVGGDSMIHLLVPMLFVVLSVLLFCLTHFRVWFLLGGLLILGYAFLMIQNALAVTRFGYTPLLALIPLYLSAVLPLFALSFLKQR